MKKSFKSALISVYDKTDLSPVVKKLAELQVDIYSTGGTKDFIEQLGVPATGVEQVTNYPSILGGRVKTLHPKIFGGILARREEEADIEQLSQYEIPCFDLVIVDLYPFSETVQSGGSHEDIIEKIDIGGISLIRATAKNYKDTVIVSHKGQYKCLQSILENDGNETSLELRKQLAMEAFFVTSQYDAAIFKYFAKDNPSKLLQEKGEGATVLRYGENPHQEGVFQGSLDDYFEQLHGKKLSYNNLLDLDAGLNLLNEFEEPIFAILKHNMACGAASGDSCLEAYKKALESDPVSAFGGVIITNMHVDLNAAEELNKLFFEIILAKSYDQKALELLQSKKNRVILLSKSFCLGGVQYRSLLGGVLVQERDNEMVELENVTSVTTRKLDNREKLDLLFANRLVKQTKSNAIVLVRDGQMISFGGGEVSRVDALKHAVAKAKEFELSLKGAVMASDAFFPFKDCVEIAYQEGVKCVIQPGGSLRDDESIQFCEDHGMSMVITGKRHFKH